MVRISDIQNNIVNWESVPFCSISDSDIETYRLSNNDLLFARTGGTVGKSYLVTNMTEDAVYAGYLIRSNYNKKLCPQFLKYFMEFVFCGLPLSFFIFITTPFRLTKYIKATRLP